MWISHAERPLKADELRYALSVQLSSMDFDIGNIPLMSTLVNCCQGLITVDKKASVVRLIRFTLQEYLSVHPDIFTNPHSAMTEICLTYLNSKRVKALSAAHSPDTQITPFLEYCSIYWGVHAKRELSDYGRSLALELLKEPYSQISTKILHAYANLGHRDHDTCPPFSGLHCASFFGIVQLVVALIEVGDSDINGESCWGRTPLPWAANNGHEGAVEILLGREEVNSDKPDKWGSTPLLLAAQHGHEGVVKILLGRKEVNPDKPDKWGGAPLLEAARNGHEGVLKILLARKEVNPDKRDNFRRTPLLCAAWSGHEGVVKILLEREEVNPDRTDIWCNTPLSHATQRGYERIVALLQSCKAVNPSTI